VGGFAALRVAGGHRIRAACFVALPVLALVTGVRNAPAATRLLS
jgi:hypothetical protein